jgi:GT2 family glycosyltransferase
MEILVVDGMSEDSTRNKIGRFAARYPFIKLVDNPKKITPCALNIGIKQATGNIIMRMDAHSTYDNKYVFECVRAFLTYPVGCVGGRWIIKPRDNTLIGKTIAIVLSHPFGVGGARYRVGKSAVPQEVDVVPYGAYKKETLVAVGPFNEQMARSQDVEYYYRYKKAGGRILLVPAMISYYYCRSRLSSFISQNFKNGMWTLYPLKFSPLPLSLRHYVPFFFASALVLGALLSLVNPLFLLLLLSIAVLYESVALYHAAAIALQHKHVGYLVSAPVVFTGLHVSYGIGAIVGLLMAIWSKNFWKNLFNAFALWNPANTKK